MEIFSLNNVLGFICGFAAGYFFSVSFKELVRIKIIYERLIQKTLHHVRYTELKKGYCVQEYAIDKEPKGCLANFFFAFRGSRKTNEFILPI